MEYNGKKYELIHDKTGNLDCDDCALQNIDCYTNDDAMICNRYQIWKECAQKKETRQQSNCNLPQVSVFVCPLCKTEHNGSNEHCNDCININYELLANKR